MTVWFLARSAGLTALVLLSVATGLGSMISARVPVDPRRRVVLQYVHRSAAGVGLAALGLHLTTILADSFAHVGVVAALVPFTAEYRPTWVGLGSIAAYTFALVGVTGFLRGRMAGSATGARIWRGVHLLAYAGWASAMLHGLRSGTDNSVTWVRWLYLGCLGVVIAGVGIRLLVGPPQRLATGRRPTDRLPTGSTPTDPTPTRVFAAVPR